MNLDLKIKYSNKLLCLIVILAVSVVILFSLSGCGEINDGIQSIFIKGNMDSYLKDKYNQDFHATGEWKHMSSSIIDGQGKWIFGRSYKYKDDDDIEFSVNVNYDKNSIADNYESTILNRKFAETVKEKNSNVKNIEISESKCSSIKIGSFYELYSKNMYSTGVTINYELYNSSNADKDNLVNTLTPIYSQLPDTDFEWRMINDNPWGCFSFKNKILNFKAWTQENINAYNKTNNFLKQKYNESFTLDNFPVFNVWNDTDKKDFHYVSNDIEFTAKYNNGSISDDYLSRYFAKTYSDTKELEAQIDAGLKNVDAALEINSGISAKSKDKNIDSLTYVGDKDSYILNNPTKFEYFAYVVTIYGMSPTDKEGRINSLKEVFRKASINAPCVIRVAFSNEAMLLNVATKSYNDFSFLNGVEITL